MWRLGEFGLAEMVQLGAELRQLGDRHASVEELAQSASDHIYENLVEWLRVSVAVEDTGVGIAAERALGADDASA